MTVSDTGPGIEAQDVERIFDRFYTTKTAGGSRAGAGLGLAIARMIAREHGGDLTARNNPDHGATFELDLPVSSTGRDLRAAAARSGELVRQPASGR